MLTSIILLFAIVILEFVLILILNGRCIANEKTIEEIMKFSDEANEKIVHMIKLLADKIVKIYEWKETENDNQ